ncbi:MAG: HU family DNA-binding protein [Treponema sp.]|nr:HU family DNA-binding protein [Treponema sp.]
MTKQELVNEMASELGITKKLCGETLNTMLEEIVKTLETGGKYTQPGFGTFKTAERNEHVGRNPATGKKMLYPKKRRLKFKVSDILKDEINE